MKNTIIKTATTWYNLLENGFTFGTEYGNAHDAFTAAIREAGIYTHTGKEECDLAKRIRNTPDILDDLLDRAQRCQAFIGMLSEHLLGRKANGYLGASQPDPDDENSHWQAHYWQQRVFLVCIGGFGEPVKELCECYTLQEAVRLSQKFVPVIGKPAFDQLRLKEYQEAAR